MIIRKAIVICIGLSCAILAVLPVCSAAAVTQDQAKSEALRRSLHLGAQFAKDYAALPKGKMLGTRTEDLPLPMKTMLEDMMESALGAQDKPFEPASLANAAIDVYVDDGGTRHIEITRADGKLYMWVLGPGFFK